MLEIENIFLTTLKFGMLSQEFVLVANSLEDAHETLNDYFSPGTFDIEYLMPLSHMLEIAQKLHDNECIVSTFDVKQTPNGFLIDNEEKIIKGTIDELQNAYPSSIIIPAQVVWRQTEKMLNDLQNPEQSDLTPLLSKNFDVQ